MIIFGAWVVLVVALDLYVDWVTPYLERVERERGKWVALCEAMRIIEMQV